MSAHGLVVWDNFGVRNRVRVFSKWFQQHKKKFRFLWTLALCSAIAWGAWILISYQSIRTAFIEQKEFTPTRVFSDVRLLEPGADRTSTLDRLHDAGLTFVSETPHEVVVQLRPLRHPIKLFPESEQSAWSAQKKLRLQFTHSGKNESVLESLQLNTEWIDSFTLEPEVMGYLSATEGAELGLIRNWVHQDEVPSNLLNAIVAVEDRRFYEHFGIDLRGLARAMATNLRTLSFAQGGSTITQQLVKNLRARKGKRVIEKFNELFYAIALDFEFGKNEILERYINELNLGQIGRFEVHGVGEGAFYYFNKKPHQLSLAETATLASLIRGPTYYSPYKAPERLAERKHWVLQKMLDSQFITNEQFQAAAAENVTYAPEPSEWNKAPYSIDLVRTELRSAVGDRVETLLEVGANIYTTIDLDLDQRLRPHFQKTAQAIAARSTAKESTIQSAYILTETTTGRIRSLMGGRNYSESNFNRIINMRRQAGSIAKPLIVLGALAARKLRGDEPSPFGLRLPPISGALPLDDTPITIELPQQKPAIWKPTNADRTYRGTISLREALQVSSNVAAVRLLLATGFEPIQKIAEQLHFAEKIPAVPSIALGSFEVSLMEMVRLYQLIGNGCIDRQPHVIRSIVLPSGDEIFEEADVPLSLAPPEHCAFLGKLLESVIEKGTARSARALGLTHPSFGKTGTTTQERDAWFAGGTPKYTAITWIGVEKGAGKKGLHLTGSGAALPIWVAIMEAALSGDPPVPFRFDEHLKEVAIDRRTGNAAESNCPSTQVQLEIAPINEELGPETCAASWPEPQLLYHLGSKK